jgi:hypothetical protein
MCVVAAAVATIEPTMFWQRKKESSLAEKQSLFFIGLLLKRKQSKGIAGTNKKRMIGRCCEGATTLSITTFNIMTFSIITLSIMGLVKTLSTNDIQHRHFSIIILIVFMLNVVMLSVTIT